MDVLHAAGLLSAIVGALALGALWLVWRRTRGRPYLRGISVAGLLLLAYLANLMVRDLGRQPNDTAAGSAPEIAGRRSLAP